MSEEALKPGQALDRYVIIERLGSGGVSGVYRARHRVLERQVAIKVLTPAYRDNAQLRERFEREAIAVSRIKHPNIVVVEDIGETADGLPFMVMELVEGQTLAQLIESSGPLRPGRAASIAIHILEGLSAAHECGYVHRDLKPSNVILIEQHGRERLKILDFGAVQIREPTRGDRLTSAGHTVGTPAYMAPEQILDPAVGPTADLYSLGVILYEMLTGRAPFRGKQTIEILKQQMEYLPPALPALGGLGPLVMRLLAKRERERPRSASEVLLAIAGMLDDLDGLAASSRAVSIAPPGRSEPEAGEPISAPTIPELEVSSGALALGSDSALEEPELPANLPQRVKKEERSAELELEDELIRFPRG